jgi:hypothetical protein
MILRPCGCPTDWINLRAESRISESE